MHFSTAILAALPVAFAQYNYGSGSTSMASMASMTSSSMPMASGTTHTVKVGDGGLNFNPNSVTAAMGDMIEFHYYPKNHSVAQSSFAAPCAPLSGSAVFSGFMSVPSGMGASIFTLMVNDTKPIWLYCSQGMHCQSGMAMVINQASGSPNTIDAYMAAAKAVTNNVSPAVVQGGMVSAMSANGSSTMSGSATMSMSMGATGTGAAASSSSSGAAVAGKSLEWSVVGGVAMLFGGLLM